MSIEVRNVTKQFGEFTALRDVSLTVPAGELVALLGPSGSGKTTLLRIIAGLETADSGAILFHGEDTTDQKLRDRKVGFVFQHYALFRHMTVFENVAFGLRVRPRRDRPGKQEIRDRVMKLLNLVQLQSLAHRYPSELSGGQRQRVALARALAVEPRVLLLDEPFGALDAKVRKELRRWLRRLHDEIHITSVFVTHDQEEALEVADRVAVMNEGRVEQEGTPEEVYHSPRTPFILNFLGNVNLFHGRMENGRAYIGNSSLELPAAAFQDNQTATVFIRPHLLDIHHQPTESGNFPAHVAHINAAGPLVRVELVSEWGDPVEVEISQDRYRFLALKENDKVFVTPKEMKVFVEDYVI
ncbi:MAG: sulfate ABC transporter ATP-binding protein [Candidatus Omnitrophica bacterium]|nr:MAG: Sulfate/thiosulfate import ATP-binding protein CysA [Candidatus Hinthialibacteria bacterium OLB16]MBE7486651.1 sulfate ABC transporter ATP-binding protein [bacterium]MBK7496209.1 sulfate ABC transporter ATP-binding protein [Candidatus Omnitrophota bacterium]MCE7908297.1 sulfate ABC transporter ATP-binding protein [Candidatus Omnitrophica bacterium COP1]MBV6481590.1 Sulfate/thiosulfate import ATP-binding protein CysA [bacterium]